MTEITSEQIAAQLSPLKLGEDRELIHWQHRDQQRLAAQFLAEQARRTLSLLSYDLAPAVYDQPPFLEAVKQLAIRSPLTEIRILLQSNERVQKQGHRLLELARRLTSKIEIRRPHADYLNYLENFLVVDATGYIRQKAYNQSEGEICFNGKLQATKQQTLFNEIWECSEADSALRRLYL